VVKYPVEFDEYKDSRDNDGKYRPDDMPPQLFEVINEGHFRLIRLSFIKKG
jgi:hypothetical protein